MLAHEANMYSKDAIRKRLREGIESATESGWVSLKWSLMDRWLIDELLDAGYKVQRAKPYTFEWYVISWEDVNE